MCEGKITPILIFQSLKLPIMTLIVNGNGKQIGKILAALQGGFYIFVFENSGGLADILAYALRHSYQSGKERVLSDPCFKRLEDLARNKLARDDDMNNTELIALLNAVEECIQFSDQLPIFKLFR